MQLKIRKGRSKARPWERIGHYGDDPNIFRTYSTFEAAEKDIKKHGFGRYTAKNYIKKNKAIIGEKKVYNCDEVDCVK